MTGDQAVLAELDLSERLRFLMTAHKLTVSELARHAGVSKSAMEKYLAGPSSPRATAVAALCLSLDVNAQWLLFGQADDELRTLGRAFENSIVALLNELKQPGALSETFAGLDIGSRDWRLFTWELGNKRSIEAVNQLIDERAQSLRQAVAGLRTGQLGPYELRKVSDREFRGQTDPEDDR